jgi:hypothetical protein
VGRRPQQGADGGRPRRHGQRRHRGDPVPVLRRRPLGRGGGKERIRGTSNIIAFRSAYPARVSIELHRTTGRQDLWVNEFTIRNDDANPLNVVDIMEFRDGRVIRQRLYYGEPWEPPARRAQWVEPMEDLA